MPRTTATGLRSAAQKENEKLQAENERLAASWEKLVKIFSQISPKRSPGTTQGPDPHCGSGP
ncbi:hypothetical protein [Streptomyces zinciresistens]|uniref:hypothetical protein n=1 Tax=Streptomyces zinciresistens TaxID=1073330 RepID=UPI00031A9EB7|nr:hypothetical protein [Streptomyces zinciresistens]